jgi:shikimate dehydrogenase
VDEVAEDTGAINTLKIGNGRWLGRNTDAAGFLHPLVTRGILLQGMRASVLGAGGSSRAVTTALARAGARVTVHARSAARARAVAALSGAEVGPWPPEAGEWSLLVNCTSVGMHPQTDVSPVPRELLSSGTVYDLVYNPPNTRLLRDAVDAGCDVIGGLEMLVAQAAEQFHWWTGIEAPREVMEAAARRRLSEFQWT